MSHPSRHEFVNSLLSNPLDVHKYIFTGTPFVFRDQPKRSELLTQHLSRSPSLSERKIIVVGSAKIGFSLSPDNFPRQFSDDSDIEIVVIDRTLFDHFWITMLQWNYPRRYRLGGDDWKWARSRMTDLYWGWLEPGKIHFEGLSFPGALRPLRNISTNWFNAFRSLSHYLEFVRRNVSGRLYRTWKHSLLYHKNSLQELTKVIRQTGTGA